MFSTQSDNCIPISPYFDIISLFAAEFEEPKIGIWGKGLKLKEFADDKIHASQKLKDFFELVVENILAMFPKAFFFMVVNPLPHNPDF